MVNRLLPLCLGQEACRTSWSWVGEMRLWSQTPWGRGAGVGQQRGMGRQEPVLLFCLGPPAPEGCPVQAFSPQ